MNYIEVQNSPDKIIVDDEDYERLCQYKWYITNGGRSVFRLTARPHHTVVGIANDVMQNRANMYDHISRDAFDNRKSNLRVCTYSENLMNRSKWSGCTSKYKGVYWNKRMQKWHAQIRFNKKRKHLGFFDSEESAAKAYDESARTFFKEFAVLNFK